MSDKKRFDYVFCDLDGTLLEDKQRHYECYKAIVKKYGGNCIPLDEYWNDKRNKVKRTVLLEKTGFQGIRSKGLFFSKKPVFREPMTIISVRGSRLLKRLIF